MFGSAIKKAHDAVEGLAVEAAFGVTAILIGCIALLFAAGGFAFWLSTMIPVHYALFCVAAALAVASAIIYFLGQREFKSAQESKAVSDSAGSPLSSLTKSLGSMAAPMDLVASGLFARQMKKSPIATIAATAAVCALAAMIADAGDDDD